MYKIRQIKYSAHSVSIQVYKIENRKRIIVRHIGTARTEQEKSDLLTLPNDFIESQEIRMRVDLAPDIIEILRKFDLPI